MIAAHLESWPKTDGKRGRRGASSRGCMACACAELVA
jgi:hypothetical protein